MTVEDNTSVLTRINAWAAELDRLSQMYAEACEAQAKAKYEHAVTEAREYVSVQAKTVAERNAQVLLRLDAAGLVKAKYEADASVEGLKKLIASAEANLHAAQSNGATVRRMT